MPMPHAQANDHLDEFVEAERHGRSGFWGNMRAYIVSLLKAYWGDAATADNDFRFDSPAAPHRLPTPPTTRSRRSSTAPARATS